MIDEKDANETMIKWHAINLQSFFFCSHFNHWFIFLSFIFQWNLVKDETDSLVYQLSHLIHDNNDDDWLNDDDDEDDNNNERKKN